MISCLCCASFVYTQHENNSAPGNKKYRWPLNIDNGFSSAFQEFRASHFHAGLDLRTQQKTGLPVYAIADGVIYKIRMVKRGSGRGLYLKHDDGNTSIYFHLERFEKKLEDLLGRVQRLKKNKYFGNYFLQKPLRYKRGDLIAYSGETGSGFPHLHVEIRDKNYFALNPFKLIEFPGKDTRSPVLSGLLLRNRGGASINGSIGETYIKLQKKNNNTYTSPEPFIVTGDFDAVLNAYDLSDVLKHVAPREISVFIDNSLYYRLAFDRFQGDDNNQLGFVYDMAYSSSSSYFYNLFSQEGFALEQQQMPLPQVTRALESGWHELRITVKDNHDNVSNAVVSFYKASEPEFAVSSVARDNSDNPGEPRLTMNIETLNADPSGDIKIFIRDSLDNKLAAGTLDHHLITKDRQFALNGVSPDAYSIDFIFSLHNKPYYKKRCLLNTGHLPALTDVPMETFINRDEVFIKLTDPGISPDNISLEVVQGQRAQTVRPRCANEFVYFCFTPMNFDNRVLLHFSILADNKKVAVIQKTLDLIYLKKGIEQTFKYHEFEASFASKSVYEPRVLKIEETNYPSEYPVLSRQVSLSPYHFPFLDTVYYKFKKQLPNPKQVGIFKYNQKSKTWSSRYTVYDAASSTYKHRLISSGVFALMRDIFEPRIWFQMSRSKLKKNFGYLTVKITDKGKGVDDTTLNIWLNGQKVCYGNHCEYDADRNSAPVRDLSALRVGKNIVKAVVSDYAGNRASRSYVFYLK
jgi:hypothetical protein